MNSKDYKYLFAYIIPLSGFVAIYLGGWYSYLSLIIAFAFIPALELFLPVSPENKTHQEYDRIERFSFFDALLFLNIPLVYGLIFCLLYQITNQSYETYEITGLILSIGTIGGASGINVAHELGHKPGKLHQLGAKTLLLPVNYLHFFIEHNRGHHLNVATLEDPATSRKGETVYFFWIRSIIFSYVHAWNLEKNRLNNLGSTWLSFKNQMIKFSIYQMLYMLIVFLVFSTVGIWLVLGVSLMSIILLETINYIEHYGILRKKLESGRYEKVTVKHSWNSDHTLGRIILYELTRHSDHHYKANKKYQILESKEESPQLPFGYPASMLISLIPPLWFYFMNKELKKYCLHSHSVMDADLS